MNRQRNKKNQIVLLGRMKKEGRYFHTFQFKVAAVILAKKGTENTERQR